jgi:hypothetical protein
MWRRDGSEGIKWWLWRLTEDGAYFGTVHRITSEPHRGSILTVEGMVPQPEWRRGREILRELSSPDVLPPGPCFALLAEAGPADQDRIFFKYDLGDEKRSRRAALFLELREILEREISKEYVGIEFSYLLDVCCEEVVRVKVLGCNPDEPGAIDRLELLVPGFSREKYRAVFNVVCGVYDRKLEGTPKNVRGPSEDREDSIEPGELDLFDACMDEWERIERILTS